MSEMISSLFSVFWEIVSEVFSVIFAAIPKIISFTLWALAAVIILPCVYIAGNWFPKWTEWGEGF